MMRASTWFPVLAAAVFAAGAIAWLGSDAALEPAPVQPGFEHLQAEEVEAIAEAGAEAHREARLRDLTERRARDGVQRWLEALPASAGSDAVPPKSIVARPASPADTDALASWTQWIDDLPAGLVAVAPVKVELGEERTGDDASIAASTTISVRVYSADERVRSQLVPIFLKLRPLGGGERAASARFALERLVVRGTAPTDGLRAYDDPVIIVADAGLHVVADADDRAAAIEVADEAGDRWPAIRTEWSALGPPATVGIWMVPDIAASSRVLGTAEDVGAVGPTALAFTDEDGDVALLWERLSQLAPLQRRATVNHELVHVATRSLLTHAPTMLLEGLAVREELRATTGGQRLVVDLTRLDVAFAGGSLDYEGLLTTTAGDFDATSAGEVQLGYLAGYATVAWIEDERGLDALVDLLDALQRETPVERAVAQQLGLRIAGLENAVRTWVDERATPPTTTTTDGEAAADPDPGA